MYPIMANQSRALIVALGLAIFASLLFGAFAPSPASAQGLPDICEQYPDRSICIGPVEQGGPDDPSDQGPSSAGDNNGSGNGDGSLPFTGYPLTGIILLLLILLAAGLAIRGYLAIRDRLGSDRTPLS